MINQGYGNLYLCIIWALIFFLSNGCDSTNMHSSKNPPSSEASSPTEALASTESPSSNEVLAKIGERAIMIEDFQRKIDNLPSQYQSSMKRKGKKEKYLDKLVEVVLFSLEARSEGLHKDLAVAARIEDSSDSILAKEYIKRKTMRMMAVSDDEKRDYYNSHKSDEFKVEESVRARHILIRPSRKGRDRDWAGAKKRARSLKRRLESGADFASLAKEGSDDAATRKSGGDLGYFTKERIGKKISDDFSRSVFSLKKGEISSPFKSHWGFHIGKLEHRRPEHIRKFEKVKAGIAYSLRMEKMAAAKQGLAERLRKEYGISQNTHLLGRIIVKKPPCRGDCGKKRSDD